MRTAKFAHPYVLAWDELREDWRTFRLDRFKLCSYEDRHFEELEVPLPDDLSDTNLSKIRRALGEDADNALVRIAWSIGIGR